MTLAKFAVTVWLLTMAALGGWTAVMILDDESPYYYDAQHSFITPDPAPRGSLVSVTWKIKVNRLCPGSSQRILIDPKTDETIATYDATATALSVKTDDEKLSRAFSIPCDLPEEVGYRSTVCFRCNPLHSLFPLCIKTPTLIFKTAEGRTCPPRDKSSSRLRGTIRLGGSDSEPQMNRKYLTTLVRNP